MGKVSRTNQKLLLEIEELRNQLSECKDTLEAIRTGQVDALVVSGEQGERISSLSSINYSYRLMVEIMTEGTIALDNKGTIVFANKAFSDLVGCEMSTIVGTRFTDYLPGFLLDDFTSFLKECIVRSWRSEFSIKCIGGDTTPVSISGTSFEIVGKQNYCLVISDLTEHKNAEQKLQKAYAEIEQKVQERTLQLEQKEDEFRSLSENSPDSIARFDTDLRNLYVNPVARKISCVDLTGKTWREAGLPKDFIVFWEERFNKVIQTGKVELVESSYNSPDGTTYTLQSTLVPEFNSNGEVRSVLIVTRDISEHKHAEEALQRSEERFRALTIATSNIVYRMSPDWSEMRPLHGPRILADTDEPYTNWISLYIPPDDQPRVLAAINEAIQTKSIIELEHRVLRKNGTLGWSFSRAIPLLDANGEIYEWFGASSEITERKQAEDERGRLLAEIEKRAAELEATISSMATGLIVYDQTGKATYFNNIAKELLPYEVFFGDTVEERARVIHWETEDGQPFPTEQIPVARALHGETTHNAIIAAVFPDRTKLWISASAAPIRTPGGQNLGVVASFVDITQRKLAEEELRKAQTLSESLNRINVVIHSTVEFGHIIQSLLAEGALVLSSQSSAVSLRKDNGWIIHSVHGMSSDIVGMQVSDDQDRHALLAYQSRQPVLVADAFNDERFNHEHLRHHNIRAALVVPLIINGEPFGVIFFNYHNGPHDFTQLEVNFANQLAATASIALDHAHLFESLSKSNYELASANKELESYSYSISHDLRAPLRAMRGFSDMLMEDYSEKLDTQAQEFIKRIVISSDRMSELIDDMLNLSKISRQEMVPQEINLSTIAEGVIDVLRQGEPANKVDVVIAQDLKTLGDFRLMEIALSNLLGNAWKYSSKTPDARIEFGIMEKDGQTVFFVRDNGVGFNMDFAYKLFEPFKRLHSESEFPGTGIGLAIVKRVIEKHRGTIWAESEVGKGAMFYFTVLLTKNKTVGVDDNE